METLHFWGYLERSVNMKRVPICLLAVALFGAATAADLSTIDRTILREPSYQDKPGYCLLVFGPEAKSRVWLIREGQTIYVDRNANSDLTEPGETVTAGKVRVVNPRYRDAEFDIGTLTPKDGSGPHSEFKISAYSEDNRVWNYVLKLKVNGTLDQFAGWKPLFQETPEKAPILHFGGPLIVQPIRFPQFRLNEAKPELHLRFATRGLGEFSVVSLGYEAIPQFIQPVASIRWPGSGEVTRVTLLSRC